MIIRIITSNKKAKETKTKVLSLKEYLYMMTLYFHDMINDHKTPMRLRVYSRNKVIDYETQFGEWKIQLTMRTNSVPSKDFGETRTMYLKSDNIEVMM